MPSIEGLIGKQPPLPKLSAIDSENLFHHVVTSFLNTFLTEKQPLVIFLDDLQWVDEFSLKWIEKLLSNSNQHLFFIGSYRENEVSASHPLQNMHEQLKKDSVHVHICEVKPLQINAIQELICEIFRKTNQTTFELSRLILQKTKGNPFYIGQFLKHLYKLGLFNFNTQSHSWSVELAEIEKLHMTENVADLISHKIEALNAEVQNLLKIGAALGQTFDLQAAADLTGITLEQAIRYLQPALQEEFVFNKVETNYSFGHDRIQQACYQLIEGAETEILHYRIGRWMLERFDKEQLQNTLIELTRHLNAGKRLITNVSEINELVSLNLSSGIKMKEIGAYQTALVYFNTGISLLPNDCWEHQFFSTFELYSNAAQCEQMVGDIEKASKYFELIIQKTPLKHEKIKIYSLQITLYAQMKLYSEAVVCGKKALSLFNFSFPEKFILVRLVIELIKVKFRLFFKKLEDFKTFPRNTNSEVQDLDTILYAMNVPLILSRKYENAGYHVLKAVQLNLKYGFTVYGPYWFGSYYMLFMNTRSYQPVSTFLEISNKYPQDQSRLDNYFGFYFFVMRWGKNYQSCAEGLKNITFKLFEVGQLSLSGFCVAGAGFYMLVAGLPLKEVIQYLESNIQEYKKYKTVSILIAQAMLECCHRLHKKKYQQLFLPIPLEATEEDLKDEQLIQSINMLHLFVLYFYGNFKEASILALIFYDKGFPIDPTHIIVYFYGGLSLCAVCLENNILFQIKEIKRCQKKLKNWAKVSSNHLHQYYLISAELAQIQKMPRKAIVLYQKAIEAAKTGNFIHDEALSYERFALFYLKEKDEDQAKKALKQAWSLYLRWGANAKIEDLKQTHYRLLEDVIIPEKSNSTDSIKTSNTDNISLSSQTLDVQTMIEASQTISKEVILEKLVKAINHILLVNAGADKTFLFLEQNERLTIKAEATLTKESVFSNNLPAEERQEHFCMPAVNYVARSREELVLNNACEQGLLKSDSYINQHKISSIAVLPLIQQKKLIGILYLENAISKGVFTDERMRLLKMLSSQIAISLENARFFERMRNLYRSTERFVPKPFLEILQKESVEEVLLGDCVEIDVSVVFTDIRNFTSIVQKRTPKQAFSIINKYLDFLAPIVRAHHGFINKFLGDGILALFPRIPEDAVDGGLALLVSLKEFNRKQRLTGELELEMGVGIDTGSAMLGITGEKERMDQTVISDVANTSARIESLNKTYKTHFLISDSTYKNLKTPDRYILRRIDRVYLMGRDKPSDIYEVIDWFDKFPSIDRDQYLKNFQTAFEMYEKGQFDRAAEQFTACLKILSEDPIPAILLERCEDFKKTGIPEKWNGTFHLKHK